MPIAFWLLMALFGQQSASSTPAARLDYEFYKARVEPIFLERRPGFTRCVVCHAGEGSAAFLQPLPAGARTWTDEQSRANFERVSKLVVPGQPMKSRLLVHPLEPAAGGDEFHNGGRQFASQDDPQFRTLAAWVRGEQLGGASR